MIPLTLKVAMNVLKTLRSKAPEYRFDTQQAIGDDWPLVYRVSPLPDSDMVDDINLELARIGMVFQLTERWSGYVAWRERYQDAEVAPRQFFEPEPTSRAALVMM